MKRILLVCTGNTCRSPMAEALFRSMAQAENVDVEVRSAGVYAVDGMPMSENAAQVLREKGVDPGSFRSSQLTGEMVQWADTILTMTSRHKRQLLEMHPEAAEKTFVLKEYAGIDPETERLIREREQLVADLQLKIALKEAITDEERARLEEYDRLIPNMDIPDPIGGSKERYMKTADLIEAAIRDILERMKEEPVKEN